MQIVPLSSSGSSPMPGLATAQTRSAGPTDVFTWTPADSPGQETVEPAHAPVAPPPTSLLQEEAAPGHPPEALDPLRQTAWHHPDVMVARMARLMVTPSNSAIRTYQDRFGPAEGCLQSMQDPALTDEALASLPAALGKRAPSQDMLWAVADQAREGNATARSLLGRWRDEGHLEEYPPELLTKPFQLNGKKLEPMAPRPSDLDPERDQVCQEIDQGALEERTPEHLSGLVERCALRGGDRDFKALIGLIQGDFGGPGPAHGVVGERFDLVSGALTRALGRGQKFPDPEHALLFLHALCEGFPDRCDAAWTREHLEPALRRLPLHEAMGEVLKAAPLPALEALADSCLEDRPGTLADWRFVALSQLAGKEHTPNLAQAKWVSQFLLPRQVGLNEQDLEAQFVAMRLLDRFRAKDPNGLNQLRLPDPAGELRPLPDALYERCLELPPLKAWAAFGQADMINRLVGRTPEQLARLREELASEPALRPEMRLVLAAGATQEEKAALGQLLERQLGERQSHEHKPEFRAFLGSLRRAWLEVAPEEATSEVCSARHKLALRLAPSEWMINMSPTLQSAARQAKDPSAVVQSAAAMLAGLTSPDLTEEQLLTLGTAIKLVSQHSEHLAEMIGAAGPWLTFKPTRVGENKDSEEAQAFGSAMKSLRYELIAGNDWMEHCRTTRDSAMVLRGCHQIAPEVRGSFLAQAEQGWMGRQQGWVRSLAEGLQQKGGLAKGLGELYERVPNLDQHGPLAVRLLGMTDGLEDAIQGLRKVQGFLAEGKSEAEAITAWLGGKLGGETGLAVDLGGLKPSVGGVLLRRKRA